MVMAKKSIKDRPYVAQFKVDPELMKRVKVAYVKTFDEDYETQDNLATKIFLHFIENVSTKAANQSK